MRVITGSARGRKLKTPQGEHTRPTAERVKEAVFSVLQYQIEGRRVLDLFAGSGQLGIEALSRGAAHATFVENDRKAADVIEENLRACGFWEKAALIRGDARTALRTTARESVDILFVDPPYGAGIYPEILRLVSEFDILRRNGIIVLESPAGEMFPELEGALVKGRDYRYGQTKITLFEKP